MTATGPASPSEAASRQHSPHRIPRSGLGRQLTTVRLSLRPSTIGSCPRLGRSPQPDRAHLGSLVSVRLLFAHLRRAGKVATIPLGGGARPTRTTLVGVELSDGPPVG